MQNLTEIVPGEPLHRGLNARGVAKYSVVGHVEGYVSETVQLGNHTRIIQWYHFGFSNKGSGPPIRGTVYIFEVNGARQVKSNG